MPDTVQGAVKGATGAMPRFGPTGLTVAILTLLVDQANKWWLIQVFGIEERGFVTVTPFLDLVFVKNLGVSYGLFQLDSPTGQWMLAGFAVAVSLAFGIWMFRAERRRLALALGLIIGGAIGNAIDRVVLGGVADFYSLHAYGFRWYVFNIADVAIVAGAALLLYDSLWPNRKAAANQR